MSRIILIDGENLLYGLRTLIGGKGKKKASRGLLLDFPFRDLLEEVLGDAELGQVFFYGAKLRRYDDTPELLAKTSEVIRQQAVLVSNLQKQGIQFVKVGYLRARETDECVKCSHTEWHLMEKGVDVGLAVKMLTDIPRGKEVVLISSDTDLLPAVKAVRLRGAKVMYVGYEYGLVKSLVGAADSTRVITREMVEKRMTKRTTK